MADEKKISSMEEYSIPEETGAGAGEYHEQTTQSPEVVAKKTGKGKRLLIPIVLVVAVFVFYQILSWYSHAAGQKGLKEEQEIARKTQQSLVTPQLPKMPEHVVETAAEVNIPPSVAPVANDQNMQNRIDMLVNRIESNSQELDKLQSGLAKYQAALVALTHTVADLSSSVQDIAKQTQQLTAPKLKPKSIPKKIKKVEKFTPPKVIYHVKAIVPGLAWLESSDGKTISARVGDKLDGYGVVQLISPQQGAVITSSGSVIQYGVNDF